MIKGPKSAHLGLKQCIQRYINEEVEDTREEEEKGVEEEIKKMKSRRWRRRRSTERKRRMRSEAHMAKK